MCRVERRALTNSKRKQDPPLFTPPSSLTATRAAGNDGLTGVAATPQLWGGTIDSRPACAHTTEGGVPPQRGAADVCVLK